MTFEDYFYSRFPSLLGSYHRFSTALGIEPWRCPHHGAGQRACAVFATPGNNLGPTAERLQQVRRLGDKLVPAGAEFDDDRFWFAWYFVTLLDQGIHSAFRPHYATWVAATGGYPLPMFPAGFGCWHIAAPARLLEGTGHEKGWSEAVEFWVGEANWKLFAMSGVGPGEFFAAIRADGAFGRVEHERVLAGRMVG